MSLGQIRGLFLDVPRDQTGTPVPTAKTAGRPRTPRQAHADRLKANGVRDPDTIERLWREGVAKAQARTHTHTVPRRR